MSHLAPIETNLFRDLLALVEHCVRCEVGDGMPRTPGIITLTTQGAAWVVEVIDPDAARMLRVLGTSVDFVLQLACELLRCDCPPWSPLPGRRR